MANEHITPNAWKGGEALTSAVHMSFKMYEEVAGICIVAQVALFLSLSFLFGGEDFAMTVRFWTSKLALVVSSNPAMTFNWHGKTIHTSAANLASSSVASDVAGHYFTDHFIIVFLSFGAWALAFVLFRIFKTKAKSFCEDKHVRGPQIITVEDLQKQFVEEKRTIALPFGPTGVCTDYLAEHILIVGKTRVGKSTLMYPMVQQMRDNNQKALIYDKQGDYTAKFFDASRGDIVMNVLDERAIGWSILNDCPNRTDIVALSQSLIPSSPGNERFWNDSAQVMLQGFATVAWHSGQKTNEMIWNLLNSGPENMATVFERTPGCEAAFTLIRDFASAKTASIWGVTMSFLPWLEFAKDGPFSIQEWLDQPGGGFIFLSGMEKLTDTLKNLQSLFIDFMMKKVLSMEASTSTRVFMVLDEFGTLPKLPSIKRGLITGGSKGLCFILAAQDIAMIEEGQGKEASVTILNSCGNTALFNVSDPSTAKYCAGRFDKYEALVNTENISMGPEEGKQGRSYSQQLQTKDLILASEFMGLPKLKCYYKCPEHNPCLVSIPITEVSKRPNIAKDFVCREGFDMAEIVAAEQARKANLQSAKTSVEESDPTVKRRNAAGGAEMKQEATQATQQAQVQETAQDVAEQIQQPNQVQTNLDLEIF